MGVDNSLVNSPLVYIFKFTSVCKVRDVTKHVAEDLITNWFDEGSEIALIYQDFSEAFDLGNHRLPLGNLSAISPLQ